MSNLHGLSPDQSDADFDGRTFRRYLALSETYVFLSAFVFFALIATSGGFWRDHAIGIVVATLALFLATIWLQRRRTAFYALIQAMALRQAAFLDHMPARWAIASIVLAAGLSLFLELVVIRWQSTLLPFFAFYKNFTLISCFVGLGIGYALSRQKLIPLVASLPLLAFMVVSLLLVRHVNPAAVKVVSVVPFSDQVHLGAWPIVQQGYESLSWLGSVFVVMSFLAIVFLGTVLIFVPIGQLCGRVMERRKKLTAYGANLAGSALGVLAIMVLSYFWTGPVVWFAVAAALLIVFQRVDIAHVVSGFVALAVIALALSWPASPIAQKIYSPYQLVQRTANGTTGLTELLIGGRFFQRVFDFSQQCDVDPQPAICQLKVEYELAFDLLDQPDQVAVVGAGTGNDVAAALRRGAGLVYAIEIDPVILSIGRAYHPERPYTDSRAVPVLNDARTFFRRTDQSFDAIIYGALDAHSVLSQASSVRLDSFVYTVEGIRDAYDRLEDDGIISIKYVIFTEVLGHRLFGMLREASGGLEPRAYRSSFGKADTTTFILRKGGFKPGDRAAVDETHLVDVTDKYAAAGAAVELATDDWPFFYMLKREYPLSYLPVVLSMLLISALMCLRLIAFRSFSRSYVSFFFLGIGFMLVETKAITELGLAFGNTWQVVGIAIVAILVMAFLANLAVDRLSLGRVAWAYAGLLATILLGFALAGDLPIVDETLYKLLTVILLTSPMLFSGIAFSVQLRNLDGTVSDAMAYNLAGAMVGGILEYNAMYFGFSGLYLFAFAFYLLAFLGSGRSRQPT